MAPIRIGFIGLSTSGGWATGAHLPYLRNTSKYTITALCNSSVEAAQAAIKQYELPSSTKAYGSPADLAKDPDVDLVVCSVRVDRHYETIKPSLEAGKDVYCEWPLGANLEQAEELAALAKSKGVKTVIGLQARRSPLVNKIKELVDSGRIGRVLSSTVTSTAGNFGPTEGQRTKYFLDRKVGGNMMTIHFGHMIDYTLHVLGELEAFTGVLAVARPKVDIVDKEGKVVETVAKDSHDQIMLQGPLKSGAVLSMHQRGGSPFKGTPGLTWRIYGDKGEIMITSAGSFLQVGYPEMQIKVHDLAKNEVENIDWKASSADDSPSPADNVGRLYEAFASGEKSTYADFEQALLRHRLLDQLYKSGESSSKQVSYV